MLPITISYYGMYAYDDTIFDELHLPDDVDREIVIENFLTDSIEREALYTDPETFKAILGIFSRKRVNKWKYYANVLSKEYNPIWNVDGTVTSQYGQRETDIQTQPHEDTETQGAMHSTSKTGKRNANSTSKVSAYNSTTLTPASGSETTQEAATDESSTDAVTNKYNTGAQKSTSTTKKITDTVTRQGNIGVTTTQKMITEEMEMRKKYDIYDIIESDLLKRFCLLVY